MLPKSSGGAAAAARAAAIAASAAAAKAICDFARMHTAFVEVARSWFARLRGGEDTDGPMDGGTDGLKARATQFSEPCARYVPLCCGLRR